MRNREMIVAHGIGEGSSRDAAQREAEADMKDNARRSKFPNQKTETVFIVSEPGRRTTKWHATATARFSNK